MLHRKETYIWHFCIKYSIHFSVLQLFPFSFLWEIRYCTLKEGWAMQSKRWRARVSKKKPLLQLPSALHCATSEQRQVKWNLNFTFVLYTYTAERRDVFRLYIPDNQEISRGTSWGLMEILRSEGMYNPFSHHWQGSIDFNTVNTALPTGMYFLIHP